MTTAFILDAHVTLIRNILSTIDGDMEKHTKQELIQKLEHIRALARHAKTQMDRKVREEMGK